MATVESLKWALRRKTQRLSAKQPLSDAQYSAGFDMFVQGSGWETYRDFIIPQLCQLLGPLFSAREHVSVLEIGPGPRTILEHLPIPLRRKIKGYSAFEPNSRFAAGLKGWISTSEGESPLPCLDGPPIIHQTPFVADDYTGCDNGNGNFDLVLFCHSMYGLKPKHKFIERALGMLVSQPEGGLVVVFHREGTLHLNGLICHRVATFPTGTVQVADDNEALDAFAPFVAGFTIPDVEPDTAIRLEWREVCRAMGRREDCRPNHLLFDSPDVMAVFTQHATALTELMAHVPVVKGEPTVKNREARLRGPASTVRPSEIRHVQKCVQWALRHGVGLTVVGGGHGGQCLWPYVVAVDMGAFDQVHIVAAENNRETLGPDVRSLVVAGAGCKTGDIINKTMAAGLTVALGSRPSVGAGLWLQGGIGHLARLHGLACDAIVGAVVVSVESGDVFCIGHMPSQYQPVGAVRPENESDFLWAIKGAGTNFGIVLSVAFEAFEAPTYLVRNWAVPIEDSLEARMKLSDFDKLVASKLPRHYSADAYLYWDANKLHLGVTVFECCIPNTSSTSAIPTTPTPLPAFIGALLGPEDSFKIADGVGLFEAEMYVSGMHGGHGGGKTSSFKRCLFLKHIGAAHIADTMVAAIQTRPTPFCYIHLLHGGGAVADVTADGTAFGCRNWDFACVVTGVWPRSEDGNKSARDAVRWVYNVVKDLLPLSSGAYGADLGPDPRDAALAAKSFGVNRPRLARLKYSCDPCGVLSYTCPLPRITGNPKLIVLVTGESCAGKDYCADIWAFMFANYTCKALKARVASISDSTKQEYAAAAGADLNRLYQDRGYKEQHRPPLTRFFQEQVRKRPRLPEEQFLDLVYGAADVDVLLITGMRDEASVSTLSHLVPHNKLLDVRIQVSKETRRARHACYDNVDSSGSCSSNYGRSDSTAVDYHPSLIFQNDAAGKEAAEIFAERYLLPFFHEDMLRLANMVRTVPDFPSSGVDFRHVLGISQEPGGLALCTSMLRDHFVGDWAKVDRVACCEAGGFVYASALALQVNTPLVLIREAGKLPPPTISVTTLPSHISSSTSQNPTGKTIEMGQDMIPNNASVVVVDDVLATGKTLCAVLNLLHQAGIGAENVSVMVIAEFPIHGGRDMVRRCGFGSVNIRSLLVFGGP